jgi:hypothetical protein
MTSCAQPSTSQSKFRLERPSCSTPWHLDDCFVRAKLQKQLRALKTTLRAPTQYFLWHLYQRGILWRDQIHHRAEARKWAGPDLTADAKQETAILTFHGGTVVTLREPLVSCYSGGNSTPDLCVRLQHDELLVFAAAMDALISWLRKRRDVREHLGVARRASSESDNDLSDASSEEKEAPAKKSKTQGNSQ